MELFENSKPYRWFLDTSINQWQNLHSSASCQLIHTKGLIAAKMGEHEQLSHQYGIKCLKRRKVVYCSIYTACVKKFGKKPSPHSQSLLRY